MTGICMRNVTHLFSDIILPVNIFKLYQKHHIFKEHKQVISNKTHRYVNEGEEEEDTNNMCREILVEPLSDYLLMYLFSKPYLFLTLQNQNGHHP